MKTRHYGLICLGLAAALVLHWSLTRPSLAGGRRGGDQNLSPTTVSPTAEPAPDYLSPTKPDEVTPPAASAGPGNAGWNNNTGWSNKAGWSNSGWTNTGWDNKGWNNTIPGTAGRVNTGSGNISFGNLPKKIDLGPGNPPTGGVGRVNSGYGAAGYGNLGGMGTPGMGKSATPISGAQGGGNPSPAGTGSTTTGYGSSSYGTDLRSLGSGR